VDLTVSGEFSVDLRHLLWAGVTIVLASEHENGALDVGREIERWWSWPEPSGLNTKPG